MGIRNTLGDLNNHLFEQLERLDDSSLTAEEIATEISRARAVTEVSSAIVANSKLMLDAMKFQDEKLGLGKLPRVLTDGNA